MEIIKVTMKTITSLSMLLLGSLGLALSSCQSNQVGYAPDFYRTNLQVRANQIGQAERAASWSPDQPVLVNTSRGAGVVGVETFGDRIALTHNGGQVFRNGALVANVENLGSPAGEFRVVAAHATAPPPNLMAVSALPEDSDSEDR